MDRFTNVDKKIKISWMIRRIISLIPGAALLICGLKIEDDLLPLKIICFIFAGLFFIYSLLRIFVFPQFEYKKYQYLVKDDEVVLMQGILFKSTVVVPIIQIQDIGYYQGPLSQMLGIARVIISTSGSNVVIDGLTKDKSIGIVNALKDKVKEYVSNRDEAK